MVERKMAKKSNRKESPWKLRLGDVSEISLSYHTNPENTGYLRVYDVEGLTDARVLGTPRFLGQVSVQPVEDGEGYVVKKTQYGKSIGHDVRSKIIGESNDLDDADSLAYITASQMAQELARYNGIPINDTTDQDRHNLETESLLPHFEELKESRNERAKYARKIRGEIQSEKERIKYFQSQLKKSKQKQVIAGSEIEEEYLLERQIEDSTRLVEEYRNRIRQLKHPEPTQERGLESRVAVFFLATLAGIALSLSSLSITGNAVSNLTGTTQGLTGIFLFIVGLAGMVFHFNRK